MHTPVMLQEAVDFLVTDSAGWYVDGTFGRGGHAGAILGRLAPTGRLLAIDRDPEAVAAASESFGADPASRSSRPRSPTLRRSCAVTA